MSFVNMGTLNASVTSAREIFKSAILSNAGSIILMHNHPSGYTIPSREDLALTRKIQLCGELMNIKLMDHIIVAGLTGDMFSFREAGLLDDNKPGIDEALGSLDNAYTSNTRVAEGRRICGMR